MSTCTPARVTVEQVREALRSVSEPCSLLMRAPTNLTDMGIVGEVFVEAGTVHVELVLTDASCIHFAGMTHYVRDTLLELPAVHEVVVTASTRTLWTPDRVRPPEAPQYHGGGSPA